MEDIFKKIVSCSEFVLSFRIRHNEKKLLNEIFRKLRAETGSLVLSPKGSVRNLADKVSWWVNFNLFDFVNNIQNSDFPVCSRRPYRKLKSRIPDLDPRPTKSLNWPKDFRSALRNIFSPKNLSKINSNRWFQRTWWRNVLKWKLGGSLLLSWTMCRIIR